MPTRLPAVLAAVCIAFACAASQASAATFTVNRTTDAVDKTVGDGICATAAGDCSLRAAVQEANATTDADTIVLPSGQTANLSIGPAGTATPATGDLDVTHDLTVRASGTANATIDANDVDRIFDAATGVKLTISHLTLQNGRVSANSGGAILNGGTLNVDDSRLTSNDAVKTGGVDGMGGAIASGGAGSQVAILRSRLDSNTASEGGALAVAGTTTVDSSTLDNNASRTGESGSGGAIQNLGTLSIVNSTISGNHDNGGNGGGALVNSGQGQVTITYSTIADNTGGTGSAIRDIGGVGSFVHVAASIVLGDCNANAPTSVAPHHNIGGGATCGLNDPDDAPNATPALDPLADNGGATVTRKLTPAAGVDGIDDVPAASCAAVADQRGGKRPVGGACDVGAYEVDALADLTLTGSVASEPVTAGDTITYSYDVAASGPDAATGIVLSDVLPAGVTYVSGSTGCAEASGTVTCALGGAPASASIVVRADTANPSLANTATLAADQNDPTPEALTLTSVVTAAPAPPGGGGGGGTGGGTGEGGGNIPPPLALAMTSFKAKVAKFDTKKGVDLTFTLTRDATVTFTVTGPATRKRVCSGKGKKRKCHTVKKNPKAGSFTAKGTKGDNKLHFSGKLKKKALKPGRYVISATAVAGAARTKARTVAVTVVKPPKSGAR